MISLMLADGLAAFAEGIEPYKDISNVTEAAGKLIKKIYLITLEY